MVRPSLGRVPVTGFDADLLIKATSTGITLLAKFDPELNKYVGTGAQYRKRYTGSKQHAVDINGKLWLSASELQKDIEAEYKRFKGIPVKPPGGKEGKKKSSKDAPPLLKQIVNCETAQISEIVPICAKKERVKSYSVNKKEVRTRTYGYLNSQKGRKHLFFFTISFPEGTPDDTCYQAFNTWLTSLRKYKMLREYLWVAERQDGKRITKPGKLPTNTVHFHMLVPHYMNVERANAMMRGTLKNLAKKGAMPGGIGDRRDKKAISYLNGIKNYNGVDICKTKTGRVINFAIERGGKLLASYLTKYVTKNDAEFTHLAWHNSRGFSALFTGVTFTFTEFNKHKFSRYLNHVRVFEMNYATFIPWLLGPPPLLENHLYQLNSYIQHVVENGSEPTN